MKWFGKELKFNGFDVLHKGNFDPATDNVATATKLQNSKVITLGGDVTGSVNFDGGADIVIQTTVADKTDYNKIMAMTIALGG